MQKPLSILVLNTRKAATPTPESAHQPPSASHIFYETRLNSAARRLKSDPSIQAIVLDIDLKDPYVNDIIEGFKDINDQIPIMLMAERHEHTAASQAVMAGADDYAIKGRDDASLMQQIRGLCRQEKRYAAA